MKKTKFCPKCGKTPTRVLLTEGATAIYEDVSCSSCKTNMEIRYRR